ncbi:bifunctional UDP-sugar hydrolase/5'-nucleotidase [Antrihabitans sp. YC2-6]|uniref:bifunctional metallophosphatase/5'-nucleotidase n=1 Tax=Antrihabitans sp. YC2-6 TaxID=2799498 RepID=UPI0018F6038E|nr:bifunctional metallophosphatase/5'-nucleotidase [Antrihabitans sp. YC2-6]
MAAADNDDTIDVRLLALNDFRGNLTPPEGRAGVVEQVDGNSVPAGGAAFLAAYVKQMRGQAQHSLLYSVGDNWGPSSLESTLFHGEPVVDLLNHMGVAASGIGNLELAGGLAELQRLERGGCHPVDGCTFDTTYGGAEFPLLASNLMVDGVPATVPFDVDFVDGIPIGVIGVLPSDAGRTIAADRSAGLSFGDELEAIDRTADLLDFFGVKAIAVLLHKGDDSGPGGPDACNLTTGSARRIAERADAKIDVVFTAAGNRQYDCTVTDPMGKPRVFMQGASDGRAVAVADVVIDRNTRDVVRDQTSTFNQVVTRDIAPDREVEQLVDRARSAASAIGEPVVGTAVSDIVRDKAPSGESPLGNLVADAQLAFARSAGAQVAFTNPGGLRGDLGSADGFLTYADAFATQPFGNQVRVVSLTGQQVREVLEQQFQPGDGTVRREILAPSGNLRYAMRGSAPPGERIVDLTIDGVPVDDAAAYRVAVNSSLADGGDGFAAFRNGQDPVDAGTDIDALVAYLAANGPVGPPATDRIRVLD